MLKALTKHTQLEQAISDYDYMGKQIKVLEMKRKEIKETLIETYFKYEPHYFDVNGCLLASWEERSRTGINSDLLEKEKPDIYAQYLIITKYMQFTVK